MDRKLNPDVHLICGKCGCGTMFSYSLSVEEEGTTVYLYCGNCSTLTGLDEIAEEKN